MRGVIVGVDGSEGSDEALDWALHEAASRGTRLTAVLAWDPGRHAGRDDTGDDDERGARRRDAVTGWVEAARERTGLGTQDVEVVATEVRGNAATSLLALAEGDTKRAGEVAGEAEIQGGNDDGGPADVLVVGRCGRGRVSRMVLGSVPSAILQHATVPVTVVRGTANRSGPIVVGVDGSATSVHALRHGADVARRTGATLEALFCWQIVTLAPLPDSWGWAPPIDDYEAFAAATLDTALTTAGVDLPDDRVVRTVRHVQAAKGVIEASSHASRLVLGNRGVGGFDRLLLGSVSRHATEYAHCPVTVVRPPDATHPSGTTEP
ncbi:universal stress protein [Cellulosimicrobium sp. PMB13]|uniref:universal stress protein n=1 Tax=Cellulosimicrobium sp. PMB13 TaxID=3120158 RepID=UPI003F4B6AC1